MIVIINLYNPTCRNSFPSLIGVVIVLQIYDKNLADPDFVTLRWLLPLYVGYYHLMLVSTSTT